MGRWVVTLAEVRLWGRTIGAVSVQPGSAVGSFQYDAEFVRSRIEVSPIVMPLATSVYRFPELSTAAFHGLPGLVADSLPDKFGNALINAWLASRGRTPSSFDAVERLCYIGNRGMGALEFVPATRQQDSSTESLQIGELVELASQILSNRTDWSVGFDASDRSKALSDILRVGTSAGGARAKAVIAWNESTNQVRSGQAVASDGFKHWLLKFDGVATNRDRELSDPAGFGIIEYAYSKMATAAGIEMSECRLLDEGSRRHFMTKRFDRTATGTKLHIQSLAALNHFDFNMAGAYSYEQALMTIRALGIGNEAVEEQFRRLVFNVLARNQDDHVKNIAFLMDRAGHWLLSPAFDVTYSFYPEGAWTSRHQMTINGKRDGFTFEDLKTCAQGASMKRGRAESIYEEVRTAVQQWSGFASEVGVSSDLFDEISRNLRTDLPN
jgi:serine/threonine-protein kinase HipA